MSDESPVLVSVDDRGVVTVALNRPSVNNAYNGAMIDGILAALDGFADIPGAYAVLDRSYRQPYAFDARNSSIARTRTSPESSFGSR